MKLFITGCNGQLGRAINKQYANDSSVELINTDVAELDITDVDATVSMIKDVKPDAIINCAAYTAVDKCETDWDNAFRINAIGPRNLSIAATEAGAKMVHISTDYVFGGDGTKPYVEFDATNPLGAYGKTKMAGENFVTAFAKDYFIIRTAWLYGEGKNFAKTMLKLSETQEVVKVVRDQYGTPTSAKELAGMIAHLVPTQNYGLFHGTCEGQCSWADFATEIFRLAGKNTKVQAITSEEYPSPTKRPAYSVLDNYMLRLTTNYSFAPWQDAIAEYIKSLGL